MTLEIISRRPSERRFPHPLLFVHGAWHGAWCWDEHFLPWFAARGFEAHAVSLRGHGDSPGREGIRWHRIADYVDDVAEAAATLDRPPVVIGHSMGGLITQKYLERHPAPAAVLLATIPTRGVLPFVTRLGLHRPLTLASSLLHLSPYRLVATPELSTAAFFSESLPETTRRAYHDRLVEESFRMILDAGVLDLPRPKRISTPILVLGADNDAIFPPHEMRATARAYGAECEILADTAHDVMLEPRWEAGAERIATWLQGYR